MHGARSVYAVDPDDISNTPLDFDIATLVVTDDGKIILPANGANAIDRPPSDWITLPGFEVDEEALL